MKFKFYIIKKIKKKQYQLNKLKLIIKKLTKKNCEKSIKEYGKYT